MLRTIIIALSLLLCFVVQSDAARFVYANRAWMTVTSSGTGTATLGVAMPQYATAAEAGITDGQRVTYVITQGGDFEVGTGIYTSAGTTLSRDTVYLSKIAGAAGTTKITLVAGQATVSLGTPSTIDLNPAIIDPGCTHSLGGGLL